jgi:hypothetical protein
LQICFLARVDFEGTGFHLENERCENHKDHQLLLYRIIPTMCPCTSNTEAVKQALVHFPEADLEHHVSARMLWALRLCVLGRRSMDVPKQVVVVALALALTSVRYIHVQNEWCQTPSCSAMFSLDTLSIYLEYFPA